MMRSDILIFGVIGWTWAAAGFIFLAVKLRRPHANVDDASDRSRVS